MNNNYDVEKYIYSILFDSILFYSKKKTFKSSSFCNISNLMVLFEIYQRFQGHLLNELHVSFKAKLIEIAILFGSLIGLYS